MFRSRLQLILLACVSLSATTLPGGAMIPDQSGDKPPGETGQQESTMGSTDLIRVGETLRGTLDTTTFQIAASLGGMRITVGMDALFAPGGSVLRPGARHDLEIIAGQLAAAGAGGVLDVTGYTDNRGDAAANRALSERQAAAVAGVFRDARISGLIIQTAGRGETAPRASNQTPEGRARNRRVVIVFQADIR